MPQACWLMSRLEKSNVGRIGRAVACVVDGLLHVLDRRNAGRLIFYENAKLCLEKLRFIWDMGGGGVYVGTFCRFIIQVRTFF